MDAALLRGQLAAFLGDEQFRKFVVDLRRAGRLRYWQEQVWGRFSATYDYQNVSPDALLAALRVCELHGSELLPDDMPLIEGNINFDQRYRRAQRREFPNAAVSPLHTEGRPSSDPTIRVWYCPDCRDAEGRWRTAWGRSTSPSDLDLTRRTTLDELGETWRAGLFTGLQGSRWLVFREQVERFLAVGDELWEWESVGFRAFAGMCGLAAVRDGRIVKCWTLGKS